MIGPGILVPLALVAVAVPAALVVARRRLRPAQDRRDTTVSGSRLTSSALRDVVRPPWRLVPEVPGDRLDGVEHVLIGPRGIYAVVTALSPLPGEGAHDGGRSPAEAVARAAIARTRLDALLQACAATSTALVTVHWGRVPAGEPAWHDVVHGHVAVDGARLGAWVASLAGDTPPTATDAARVDLAWRTVTVGIGRPDPLAPRR